MTNLSVNVEFKGGMEYLFDKKCSVKLVLPADGTAWTLKKLIEYLKLNHLKEKPELFVENDSVRPGILVLVNEVDWELLGGKDYQVQNMDKILFISTLHGG